MLRQFQQQVELTMRYALCVTSVDLIAIAVAILVHLLIAVYVRSVVAAIHSTHSSVEVCCRVAVLCRT